MAASNMKQLILALVAFSLCAVVTVAAAEGRPAQQTAQEGVTMDRATLAAAKMQQLSENMPPSLGTKGLDAKALGATDPDFVALRERLIYGEIAWQGSLSDALRGLITLVVLTTCQTLDDFTPQVSAALQAGAKPVEIKEALYQCAPYIGFPRTEKALQLVNEVFSARGIALSLQSQQTVTEQTRFAEGLKAQKSIFGDGIDKMHQQTPASQKTIVQNYLSAFCFGDVYTRKGLDLQSREILTFCILSALGGCESQVKSHVQGNINVGNTKEHLIDALAQCLPYIGFPRTLNALACVNAVVAEKE